MPACEPTRSRFASPVRAPLVPRRPRRGRSRRPLVSSTSTTKIPSRIRKTSVPGSPCRTRVLPSGTVRISGLAPPCMIAPDSERSSADSTGGNDGRGILRRPRVSVAEGVVEPGPKSSDADFSNERSVGVVDPVARERAGAHDLVARGAVDVEGEGQRRPHDRRPEMHERLCGTGRGVGRPMRPPTVWTKWARSAVISGRAGCRAGARREPHRGRPDADGRRADEAPPEVAGADDPAVLDLDVRPQLVGDAEPVVVRSASRSSSWSGGGSS